MVRLVPRVGLAEVLRRHGPAYLAAHCLSVTKAKAWRAILACRTAALGGHVETCEACGTTRHVYHSCRNRHCPLCQIRAKEAWLAARRRELLPVPYFHLVFTLPHDLNGLIGSSPRLIYETRFAAVSATLTEFAANPRWLGGTAAFTLVLHTWKQDLGRHGHIHALMAGGVLFTSPDLEEECAKVDMLGAWAISLLMGEEHDVKKFAHRLASHEAKNFSNAYMLPPTEAEKQARERSDWEGALDAFKKSQTEFHLESNTAKNAALYVDFRDGLFTTPSERVTEVMLSNLADRNAEFLGYANDFVRVLAKWQDCADDVGDLARWFTGRAEELKTQGSEDPRSVLSILTDEAQERLFALPINKQGSVGPPGAKKESEVRSDNGNSENAA